MGQSIQYLTVSRFSILVILKIPRNLLDHESNDWHPGINDA